MRSETESNPEASPDDDDLQLGNTWYAATSLYAAQERGGGGPPELQDLEIYLARRSIQVDATCRRVLAHAWPSTDASACCPAIGLLRDRWRGAAGSGDAVPGGDPDDGPPKRRVDE